MIHVDRSKGTMESILTSNEVKVDASLVLPPLMVTLISNQHMSEVKYFVINAPATVDEKMATDETRATSHEEYYRTIPETVKSQFRSDGYQFNQA